MEQGKNVFTIEHEVGRIKNFEKEILSAGYCDAFLPTSFVRIGQIEKTNYDCSGFKPIASCAFRNSRELMSVLEKCVLMLLLCCEHLMNPRKMELNAGTVFWSKSRNEIKLAYVPRAIPADKAIHVLLELIDHLKRHVQDGEMYRYLKAVEEYIDFSNGSFYDVMNYIGELKQEIHVCGWNQ